MNILLHSKSYFIFTKILQNETIKMYFRSSSASAAVAFAVATAGSSNPPDLGPPNRKGDNFKDAAKRKCSITSNVSTLRVLSVLRHWVTKHSQDFEANHKLKHMTIDFLEDIICTPTLLPSEHRASSQLLRMLTKDEPGTQSKINLDDLLRPIQVFCILLNMIVPIVFASITASKILLGQCPFKIQVLSMYFAI